MIDESLPSQKFIRGDSFFRVKVREPVEELRVQPLHSTIPDYKGSRPKHDHLVCLNDSDGLMIINNFNLKLLSLNFRQNFPIGHELDTYNLVQGVEDLLFHGLMNMG